MTLDFTQPLALLLLLVLPAFWLIDRVSRTHLPRKRRQLVLVVRMLVAALMILGLAGPRIIGQADEQAVAFLVDVSDSVVKLRMSEIRMAPRRTSPYPGLSTSSLPVMRAATSGAKKRERSSRAVVSEAATTS